MKNKDPKEEAERDDESLIYRMHEKKHLTVITCLHLSKMQITEIDKKLSEKQRWYILTADCIIKDPNSISKEEKKEFLDIHLSLMEIAKKEHINKM